MVLFTHIYVEKEKLYSKAIFPLLFSIPVIMIKCFSMSFQRKLESRDLQT